MNSIKKIFKVMSVFLLLLFNSGIVTADTPWLHVEGNTLRDPSGNIVILRGSVTHRSWGSGILLWGHDGKKCC